MRTLKTPRCRTRTSQSDYFNRIVKLRNKTIDVVLQKNFSSLLLFKRAIEDSYKLELTRPFDLSMLCIWISVSNCFFHRQYYLVIVIAVSQTQAIDGISRWYCFPTRFKPELYHSTIYDFLLSCSALVVCCVLFVCDIMYNVCMLFILLWERCLAWAVVILPRLHFFPFGPLFACFTYIGYGHSFAGRGGAK